MPVDLLLGFASWTPNVRVAGQRKNSRTSSRSNPTVLGNRTSANYTASNPKSQPSTSSAFGYQPPTPSQTVAFSSPFSVLPAVKALSTLMKLDSSSRPRGPLTEAEKQFRKQRAVYAIIAALIPWAPLASNLLNEMPFEQNDFSRQKSWNVVTSHFGVT